MCEALGRYLQGHGQLGSASVESVTSWVTLL